MHRQACSSLRHRQLVLHVCVTVRNKSHVPVTLLSRECFYSGNWRSILLVRLYTLRGVRQDHVRAVIADSALLSSMEMYAFLLRPGLAALDNLADKFVAGWLLPSKVLDLSYPTPPLPLLVFAIQSDEGRQLAGRSTASRRRYRGQDSILIILEYQSIITVEKLQLWCTNSGCNTRYSKILFTVVVESNAESILQGSLRFFLKPVQLHQQ